MSISLIIPAYNEEKRLGVFLQSIVDYSNQQQGIREIIVVDDGSTDATVSVAEKFSRRLPLRVLRHVINKGKGTAVRTGVMAARGDCVIFMDADGATPITELPKMTDALKEAQVAIGNRWMAGSQTYRHSLLRRLAGFIYRRYMRLFGLGQIDTMCGFKGYHSAIARKLFSNLQEERWLFDAEVAYKAVRAGYTIENFPIKWESKDGSKLDTKTLLKTAFKIWPLINKIK